MGHPGDIAPAPSFTGLMRIKRRVLVNPASDERPKSAVRWFVHRYQMAAVFVELLFSDVRGAGKRSR